MGLHTKEGRRSEEASEAADEGSENCNSRIQEKEEDSNWLEIAYWVEAVAYHQECSHQVDGGEQGKHK